MPAVETCKFEPTSKETSVIKDVGDERLPLPT